MTIYVASLFLPYTVHFEVEASKIPLLDEDEMAEPVADSVSLLSGKLGSPDLEYEPAISMYKTFAANHSTSNLGGSVTGVSGYESPTLRLPESGAFSRGFSVAADSDTASVSSNGSDAAHPPHAGQSVRDFFFNNPNSTRISLASPTAEETTRRQAGSDYFSPSPETSLRPPLSQTSSTFIQPRARVSRPVPAQAPSTTGSGLGEMQRPKLESTPSTRSLSRVLKQRRVAATHSSSQPPSQIHTPLHTSQAPGRTIPGVISSSSSSLRAVPAPSIPAPSAVSGSLNGLAATAAAAASTGTSASTTMGTPALTGTSPEAPMDSLPDELDDELDRYFNSHENTDERLIPFGGFSRDYSEMLGRDQQVNPFATAPWHIVGFERGNGSLRNAVRLAVQNGDLSDVQWVGTPGMPSDLVPDTTRSAISDKLRFEHNCDTIFVGDDVFEGYYDQYCKQVLWPIMQYQLPETHKKHEFLAGCWQKYEEVNQLFADHIIARYKEGDVVWVHDYHLMLVPAMVRAKIPNAEIGFFLHVSFPSSEVFRCLAQRKEILEGVLGADAIGMQTEEHVGHFFQSCNRLLLADFNEHGVTYGNRTVSVTHNPIGIDASSLQRVLDSEVTRNWRRLVRERWASRTLIVSRDKVDPVRGLKEKLLAYERFLQDNPEYLDKVLLLLICLPGKAASDDKVENDIMTIAERINARSDNITTDRPVVVLNQDLQFEQYLAVLSEAGLFIVSTLREGMNLTCHEFVEASSKDHSPLILSEFVGSARVLAGGALITNPYNISEVSDAIKRSVEMPDHEKNIRWNAMHNAVLRHDSSHWVIECMSALRESYTVNQTQQSSDMKRFTFATLFECLPKGKRLFILDAGDLTSNLQIQGTRINPIQQRLVDTILNNLASDPRNCVYLIGHSTRADMDRRYQALEDVGMLAENGSYVRLHQGGQWESVVESRQLEWVPAVVDVMKSWSDRIPGTYVQMESSIVRFHTENSHDIDPEHKDKLVGELMTHVNEMYGRDWSIHAVLEGDIVSVQRTDSTENGLEYIVSSSDTPYELVFVAGSAHSVDEDVYGFFQNKKAKDEICENVVTVKVGNPKQSSSAEYKVKGTNELMTILSAVE